MSKQFGNGSEYEKEDDGKEEIPYKHLYWLSWFCILVAIAGIWKIGEVVYWLIKLM